MRRERTVRIVLKLIALSNDRCLPRRASQCRGQGLGIPRRRRRAGVALVRDHEGGHGKEAGLAVENGFTRAVAARYGRRQHEPGDLVAEMSGAVDRGERTLAPADKPPPPIGTRTREIDRAIDGPEAGRRVALAP